MVLYGFILLITILQIFEWWPPHETKALEIAAAAYDTLVGTWIVAHVLSLSTSLCFS